MIRLVLILAASVWAQAWHRPIILPDGAKGFSIRCDNRSMNECYELAGDICFRGYDIQNDIRNQGYGSAGDAHVVPGVTAEVKSASRSVSQQGLLIKCKEPELTESERASRGDREHRPEKAYQGNFSLENIFLGSLLILVVLTPILIFSYAPEP